MAINNFDYRVVVINLVLSCVGMIFFFIQNWVNLHEGNLIYLICLHYFGVNISYYFLIEIFSKVINKKFWRRRKGFTTVLIFSLANLFVILLVVLIFYYIYLFIEALLFERSEELPARKSSIDVQIQTRNTIQDLNLIKKP